MTATKQQPIAGYHISDPSDPTIKPWLSDTPDDNGYTSEPLYAGAAPAAVAPQGEYPHLPQSVGDVTDFGDGKVDIDWGHPAPVGGTRLYSADQMRAYVDADRVARAGQPAAVTGPALALVERQALEALCAVAVAAFHAADDSSDNGNIIEVQRADFEALDAALDLLDELPDDQPGYTMTPGAKAKWALRRLLDAAPALEAPAAPAAPLKATPEMRAAFRRAYREGGFWDDRLDYALDQMLAAAPQAPAKGLPYEPTSDMLIAGRACDPALPVDTVRAIWWAMWRTAPQAPAAPVVDAGDQVLGEWPRVSGVGRDAESPRTLLLYLQTEASDDELRAIHDALLDGGALATHALSELMHIGYRVEGGKLVPPENLSVRASEFFGVTAVAAKATAAHSDDLAVDRFAAEMKSKLAAARAKGRGGWETCPPEVLSRMLREHTEKGDPRDVANFCMFLWCLGHPIGAAPAAPAVDGHAYAETVKKAARYDWLRGSNVANGTVLAEHFGGSRMQDFDAVIDAKIAAQAAAKGA